MTKDDQFIPHLIVSDGRAALKFYQDAFGAAEGHQMMSPDGKKLLHGELTLDGHTFFISDEFAESEGGSLKSPGTLGGTCVRITLLVEDADTVAARAIAAGAQELMPVQDMFWGARYGKLLDPYGHEWGINQQVQEQSNQETEAAGEEFFRKREQQE
jgi:PhnB protein